MKKFYSLMLTAITMLLASFTANAALTVELSWDEADAVDIYVGGTGAANKVTVPAGATSYTASRDNTWGATYVAPREGYKLVEATCLDCELSEGYPQNPWGPISSGMINVDMSKHNGHRVHVTVKKIEYDSTISVNVINGREKIKASFWGTNREVTFHTGIQTIPYSTEFETGINITAPAAGAVEPYIKQNGVEMEWQTYYGWDTDLYHKYNDTSTKGFGFDQGTEFEIKYCDTDDDPEVVASTATVTLDLQGQAEAAILMIRNVTKNQSITARNRFDVDLDDVIRFSCNTKDYELTFNGTPLTPSTTTDYTTKEFTVTENMTITVSAKEREYGTVTLTFYANDIEGLIFTDGGGKVIDPSTITKGEGATSHSFIVSQTEKDTKTVYPYTIEVSQKWGKAFIDAKEGYWLKYAEAQIDGDWVGSTMISETTMYAWSRPIVADSKLSVWMRYNEATVEKPTLRDRNGHEYMLEVGYNEFTVDGEYVSPLKAQASWNEESIDPNNDPSMEVYVNGSAVSADDNGIYNATIKGNSAIHVIAGQTATPVDVTSNVTPEAWEAGASITVDYITELSATKTTVTSFTGCDAVVKTAGEKFYINGQLVDDDYSNRNVTKNDDGNYTIRLSSATNSFAIGDFAKMNVSYNGTRKSFIIAFPNATLVQYIEDEHEPFQITNNTNQSSQNFTISEVSGAAVPTFSAYCTDNLIGGDTFTFMIPADAFKVNGMVFNLDDTFSTDLPLEVSNIPVTPLNESVSVGDETDYTLDYKAFIGEEDSTLYLAYTDGDMIFFDATINDESKISISYEGAELANGTDYIIMNDDSAGLKAVAIMFEDGVFTKDGRLLVTLGEGALQIKDIDFNAETIGTKVDVASTAKVIGFDVVNVPTSVNMLVSPSDGETVTKWEGITVQFPGATTVTVNEEVVDDVYMAGTNWSGYAKAESVSATEDSDGIPTFLINITPTVSNTYKVMIPEGLFTVDGVESPEMMYTITYNRPIDMTNVAVMVTPTEGNVLPADFYPTVIFVDAADPDPEFFGWNIDGINNITGITLSYNDNALTYDVDWDYSIENNFFMIGLAGDAEEGIYTLNIAANAINVGGTAYPNAISATWTVKSHPMHIAANVNDEYEELLSVSDLESLEKIYIRFPEAESVSVADEAGAILSSTDADYYECGAISEVEGTDKPTFEIAFPLPTQTGDYNLSLEKGTFTIDGYHDSPARSFDLQSIASAITGIQADADGRITVITIDGRVLMQNAAPEAVKDLKGLYIINGRKELKK